MSNELDPSEYNYCSECRSSEQYEAKLEAEIKRLREENKRLLDRCISLVEQIERLREEVGDE